VLQWWWLRGAGVSLVFGGSHIVSESRGRAVGVMVLPCKHGWEHSGEGAMRVFGPLLGGVRIVMKCMVTDAAAWLQLEYEGSNMLLMGIALWAVDRQ